MYYSEYEHFWEMKWYRHSGVTGKTLRRHRKFKPEPGIILYNSISFRGFR